MLDLNKPVQTRDGKAARIICTDRKHSSGRTILALVTYASGGELTVSVYPSGSVHQIGREGPNDLINVVEKSSRFGLLFDDLSVYCNATTWFDSLEGARAYHTYSVPGHIIEYLLEDGEVVGTKLHSYKAQ